MKVVRTNLLSLLNAHFLALALLLVLNLVLGARLFFAWRTLNASGPEQLRQKQADYLALSLETRPLRGLPGKVDQARSEEERFYDQRFPAEYSTVLAVIGDLASKANVHLTRNAYPFTPVAPGLGEIRMDASLSGDYSPMMHFINSLERSKSFFLIDGLTLTGQQGGMVNLRLRLTTYLRNAPPDDAAAQKQANGTRPLAEEGSR